MLIKLTKFTYLFMGMVFIATLSIAQPKVIIKLDDLGSKDGVTTAEPVLNRLLQRKIKAALGVIAIRLDETAGQAYKKYTEAKNDKGGPLFEIWNHGYDHSSNNPPNNNAEFNGTSYAFQLEHLEKSSKRVESLLGVKMRTFGAPFNANDTTFNRAATATGQYDAYFFNFEKLNLPANARRLTSRLNMESETGKVNYDYFVAQYEKEVPSRYKDLIILQGHPNMWDSSRLAEFEKILDYLIAQHCEFILPHN